ncbi:lactosylceramide alpha-2,3-sialyltransferase isoform X1 [Tachysurus ichikawai]
MSERQCKFKKEWKEDPQFRDWLGEESGDAQRAYCKFCRKFFDVGNMGLSALKSNERGQGHVKIATQMKKETKITHFLKEMTSEDRGLEICRQSSKDLQATTVDVESGNQESTASQVSNTNEEATCSGPQSNSTLSKFFSSQAVLEAEIRWVIKMVRLNSGPLRDFSRDVGNRTTIRMSYPEGTPKTWEDVDPQLQFVAVIYKSVDFNWLHAMISRTTVSLWDKLFFWQKVPGSIPVDPSKFRILNPEIIRETALKLLQYPNPKPRRWGWDQNVPTLGVSAVNLATYLCDEVSLAGFGYNLSQKEMPLHYYDKLPMTAMLKQAMHNVDHETVFLQRLVATGSILDLTGGVHCSFCSK